VTKDKPSFTLADYLINRPIKRKRGRPRGSIDPSVHEAATLYYRVRATVDAKFGWKGKHGARDEVVDFVLEKMKEQGRRVVGREAVLNYLKRSKRQQ